jgi:YD repeat-containing protein
LLSSVNVSSIATFDIDSLGRTRSEDGPDRGKRSWEFRDDGTLRTATDAKGQVTVYGYDAAGRLTDTTEHDATGTTVRTRAWTWDESNGKTHGAGIGRVVRATFSSTAASGSADYTYAPSGQLSVSRRCVEAVCASMALGYDQAGRPSTLTYPDREVVTNGYDQAGRLRSVTGHDVVFPNGRKPAVTDWAYAKEILHDASAQPRKIEYGNGVVDTLDYDPARRWLEHIKIEVPASGASLFSADYEHHVDGYASDITEHAPGLFTEHLSTTTSAS